MKTTGLFLFIVLSAITAYPQDTNFIRGADLSFSPQIEDFGGKFTVNHVPEDVLDIFQQNGLNYVRLRIWYAPSDGYCGLAKTIAFAKRVKAKGLKFLLDFHYSDWWADPGTQTKPAAWDSLPFSSLLDSMYAYTKFVILSLKGQNAMPDMVQLGNEIASGMLWPDGRNDSPKGWSQLGQLLKKGYSGVKDAAAGTPVKIMLHMGGGGDNAGCRWWFDNVMQQGVPFDVIGISYYPWWSGSLSSLQNNVNDLAIRYNKEIAIAETSYPWTMDNNDSLGNIVWTKDQLLAGYPATVQGQINFVTAVKNIVAQIPNKKGMGFFYWAPDCLSLPNLPSALENWAVFDFHGEALSSISIFHSGYTNVENEKQAIVYGLGQNSPNPFNLSTKIKFQLPKSTHVTIKVYDIMGREVAELLNEERQAGDYEINFNAANLSSGYYIYRMQTNEIMQAKKMLLLK